MKYDINDLNSEQKTAMLQTQGPVVVTACAGSGKTRLLTHRIAYLIENMGVSASNILAITFTNKATNEMSQRLSKMVPSAGQVWISTFHAMCCKILRKHIINLKSSSQEEKGFDGNFSVYNDSDTKKAIKDVCVSLKLFKEDEDSEDKSKFIKQAAWHIGNAKNNNMSPWEYLKAQQYAKDIDDYVKVYSAYQVHLKNNNALDFEDLLTKTYELFKASPAILEHYQNKFIYIHVDEFQDTNIVQYEIVKLLAEKHKNLFVVGDEDQCIYGWRGANVGNMLSFTKDFENTKEFKLEQNYRSTKHILTAANNLIKNNNQRNEKTLWTKNSEGVKFEKYEGRDEYQEAEYVATTIYNLVHHGDYKYSDIAVLMRLNALTRVIEEKCLNYNIPYNVFGGPKFYERVEIKNIIAYLRLFVNPQDSAALFSIINYPKRNIGQATIDTLFNIAEVHKASPLDIILNSDEYMLTPAVEKKLEIFKDLYINLLKAYDDMEAPDFIEHLIKKVGIEKLFDPKNDDDLAHLQNIGYFVASAQEYFKNNPGTGLAEYLQGISLISDIDNYDDGSNCVTLATVHAVKGLEFKVVFVMGLEQEAFPIIRHDKEDLEEERRLMYVAITRARERLYLTLARSRALYGDRKYTLPSQFLDEIVDKQEQIRYSNVDNYNLGSYQKSKVSFSLESNYADNNKKAVPKFKMGDIVLHTKYGIGKVINTESLSSTRCITVEFKDIGTKSLSVDYAPLKIIEEKK